MRVVATLALFWVWTLAPAQVESRFSNLRSRTLDALTAIQTLDSFTIAAPLVSVTDADMPGRALNNSFFTLQNQYLLIDTARLKNTFPDCRRIRVQYRVLPYNLSAPTARLDTVSIRKRLFTDAIEFDYAPYEPAKKPWESSGIRSTGVYTRGLSFGNSQNLVFNSNLNLQLEGKLGNDLELSAALSDNSIPIQPDGTTRQLKEFDRVFIQLKRKSTTLTTGDYDLTRPAGYFSNYFKRLQGAMVETQYLAGRDTMRLRTAAAVSRGKFARQIIQGQEGNQGPYRLQGAEGERFIIVLAGTERVFIDGQLMRRGLEDDYVIDYNLGEIAFTPRRLVTKDSRIIVEFEYAVQTYLRSTAALDAAWNNRLGKVYFNFYSEQDARNNGGAQELSAAERGRLAQSGDDLRNAFASGIDTLDNFDAGRVMYRSIDTTVCGTLTTILVYSTQPDSARYAARFTEVPQGQGNYKLVQTSANGRVFRWSAPDPVSCQPTGNFEPVVKLFAPELKQLWSVGADLKPFKNAALNAELSVSNRDINRFSPLGDADNAGLAGFLRWNQKFKLGKNNVWKGETMVNMEATTRTFQSLNPYRPAEFIRDWNTNLTLDTVAEQIARAGLLVQRNNWGQLRYEFGTFRRAGVYQGERHFAAGNIKKYGWELAVEGNSLQTDGLVESTRFQRPKADLSRTFFVRDSTLRKAVLKVGLYFEQEKNSRKYTSADTLNAMSFQYNLYRAYFQTTDAQRPWQLGGFVAQRSDFAPDSALFRRSTIADEWNLNGSWNNLPTSKNLQQSFAWVFTYRDLRIEAPELTTQKAQNTYLGKVDYSLNAFRNALNLSANYELGSGQSPRLEFNYLKVNPGEGQFTWVDRNRDSILQVDEMELAVFLDQASYVRVAVTTPDYIRTNHVIFNPSLRLEPRLWWVKPGRPWQKVLVKFSLQSNLQINRKTYDGAPGVQPWNPFQLGQLADSALVTLAAGWRNTLFVNRADPKWDASISYGDNRSRLAVTTGFEQRSNSDVGLHGRLNLSRRWSLESDLAGTRKTSDNQAFKSRNFAINALEAGPRLTWLTSRSFRLAAAVKWKTSENTLGEKETASQYNWSTELTWNPAAKPNQQGRQSSASLRAKATFADIRYTGQNNSAVAFTMLDGLQNGKNFIWSLNLDRQLSKTVQLSLNYEGRKTGENRPVHIGRAQVRALF